MDSTLAGRITSVLIITGGIGYFSRRLYQNRNNHSRSLFRIVVFLQCLELIEAVESVYEGVYHVVPSWSIGAHIAFPFSVVLAYFAIDQFLNSTEYISVGDIFRHPLFASMSVLILVMTGIVLKENRPVSFIDTAFFESTWTYCIPYLIYYFCLAWPATLIARLFWLDLQRYHNLEYQVRRVFCLTGAIAAASATTLANINLILFLISENPYKEVVNWWIQDVARGFTFLCLMVGLMLPTSIFCKLLYPLECYMAWRHQQQQELRHNLHQHMIKVVPAIRLWQTQPSAARQLIEISHARQIIWSHQPPTGPINAKAEAELLIHLAQTKTELSTPGPYVPAIPRRKVHQFNIEVAQHLRRHNIRMSS